MKIFTAQQLLKAEKVTVKNSGITSADLMERASIKVFEWLNNFLKSTTTPIYIFCGIGNNGGDGLVVARLLVLQGYDVDVFVVNFTDKRSENFLKNYGLIKEVSKKWPTLMKSEADFPAIEDNAIIIDAIFGIGLNRPPEGWVKKLIQYLNNVDTFKLSIDMPSGLFAESPTEDFDSVFKPSHILTFQAPKMAFFLPETGKFAPSFDVLDIGLDKNYLESLIPFAQLISKRQALRFYKKREMFTHKNTYGHALIIAGSYGKIGAAILSAKAAFRSGAGVVTVFAPKCGYTVLQTTLPEAMLLTDINENYITDINFEFEPTVIGIGMGIGTNTATAAALKNLFSKSKIPLVIDADALNCISKNKPLLKLLPKNSILTPHPGELERLIGSWKNDYEKLEKTKKFSKKHNVIVVIKGFYTITLISENLYVNTTGNPGMATAGSGDALSGVLTGLLSQGYDPLVAAVFGVYLHGIAGDIASNKMGFEAVMAGDIIENIGYAYLDLFEPEK